MESFTVIRRLNFLLAIVVVRVAALTQCKVDVPENAWAPAAAYAGVKKGLSAYLLPNKTEGFTRTATLMGFCDAFPTTDTFTKVPYDGDYLYLNVTGPTNISLTIDGQTKPLQSIAFAKSPAGEESAFFRLQFVGAALVMGLKKSDSGTGLQLATFLQESEESGSGATTTGSPVMQSVNMSFNQTPLGDGQCVGTVSRQFKKTEGKTETSCREECQGSIQEHSNHSCKGYMWNADADTPCVTFEGEAVAQTRNPRQGWKCWSLIEGKPAKTNSSDVVGANVAVAKTMLQLPQIPDGLSAQVESVSPPRGLEACFEPVDWLVAQDASGALFETEVADWDDFVGLLPGLSTTVPSTVPGSAKLDRVLIGSCGVVPSWTPDCTASDPVVAIAVQEDCDGEALITAAMTALVTALAAWALVWCIYKFCFGGGSRSVRQQDNATYAPLGKSSDNTSCTALMLIVFSVAALFMADLTSYVMVEVFDFILAQMGCPGKPYDLSQTMIAAWVSVTVAVICGLLYMSCRKAVVQEEQQKPTLMVCRVEQTPDGPVAYPIDERELQTSASATGTYGTGGY